MAGDANVNFPMDGVAKQAQAELDALKKIDQTATESAKLEDRIIRKNPGGVAGAALRQKKRMQAAGVALPSFAGPFKPQWVPGTPYNPNTQTLPPGFAAGRPPGNPWVQAVRQLGAPPAPGAAPVVPAVVGAAAGVGAGAAGVAGAGIASTVKDVSTLLAGPFTLGLATATAGLALFANAVNSRTAASGQASTAFGATNLLAGQAALVSGGSASKYASQVNASADPDAARQVLQEIAARAKPGSRRVSPADADAMFSAINAGVPVGVVLSTAANNNFLGLRQITQRYAGLDTNAKTELDLRRLETVADTNAKLAADPAEAVAGRLRAALIARWRQENPVESAVTPDRFLRVDNEGVHNIGKDFINTARGPGTAPLPPSDTHSIQDVRGEAGRAGGALHAPAPVSGTPALSPRLAVPQPPFNPAHSGAGPVGSLDHAGHALLQVAHIFHANTPRRASPYWANPNSNPA